MSQLGVRLLGPPRIELDGQSVHIGRAKAVALLAYLAVTGTPHTREALATLLWPECTASRARANLRRVLATLRHALGKSWLEIQPETLALFSPPASSGLTLWLDVVEFRERLAACQTHDHRPEQVCPDSVPLLTEAVELYRDDFLAGFTLPDSPGFDEWQFFESENLRGELARTLECLLRWHSSQREYDRAIAYARRWLALNPLHERAHQSLMRLYALSGQEAAALRQYQLCQETLAEELGMPPSPETVALMERIRAGDALDVEREPRPAVPHNLPSQPTAFVGREVELAELSERIADPETHLVTILGPGGCGKTRLALEAAARHIERYPDGVWFVSLAALNAPESIVPAVAGALGFSFYEGGERQQQLLDYLRAKTMLLIMDNHEHLLGPSEPTDRGGAALVAEIIRTAPKVKIVATSRARLNVGGEYRYQVSGMRYPASDTSIQEPDEAVAYSAVRLFTQGARRARRDFVLSAENVGAVVEVCRMVEGMPLAIRLAAPWVAVMPPQAIAAQLAHSLDLLATERGDVPERQRSVWASLDYTWRLISERERELMEALSIFRGGFTLEAAQQMGGASLLGLKTLVDRSLLQFSVDTDRYEIHELLRQYGARKLAADPEREAAVRDRHCAFYCALLGRLGETWNRGPIAGAIEEVEADWENVQDAWERAACEGNEARLDTALDGLKHILDVYQHYQEAEALFQLAIDGLTGDSKPSTADRQRVLAMALFYRAQCNAGTGRGELARAATQKGKALLDDPLLSGCDTRRERARLHITWAQQAEPDWEKARGHLQQALELQRELGYEGVVAYRHMSIGWNCLNSGEFERARQCFDECLALFRAFGNHNGVHRSLTSLGWLAVRVADWAAASARFEEALSVAGGLGDQVAIADALFHLGSFAMHQGEFEAAAGYLRESADQWRTVGNRAGLCWAVNELSSAYRFSCQFDKAYAQVEDSLSIAREMDAPWLRHVATAYRAWLDVTVGRYDTAQTYAQESIAQYPGGTSHTHLDIAQAALGWTALSTKDYEGAERVLKESIANARAVTNRVSEAWSLTALGGVAFGLGRREEAHALLLEALELLIESRAFAMLLHLLPIVTVVLADDDDVDKKVRAAELHGLCISHPFLAQARLFEDIAWRNVRAATETLPPDVIAAAQERGRELDWWETAEALLTELDW